MSDFKNKNLQYSQNQNQNSEIIFEKSNFNEFQNNIKNIEQKLNIYSKTIKPQIFTIIRNFLGKTIKFYNDQEYLNIYIVKSLITNKNKNTQNFNQDKFINDIEEIEYEEEINKDNYLDLLNNVLKVSFVLKFWVPDIIGDVNIEYIKQDEAFLFKSLVDSFNKDLNIKWHAPKIDTKNGFITISGIL